MGGQVRVEFVDKTGKLICFAISSVLPNTVDRILLMDKGIAVGEYTVQNFKWVCQPDHALLIRMEVK